MISILIGIVGIILTIFLVVGVHELGHFLVARWVGIKVLMFSIGFGKHLIRWHDRKGTEYVLAAIPLGGYVKLLDELETSVSEEERHLAFNTQPFWKKFAVVAAGPLMNLIFAFFLYWIIFMIGFVGMIPLVGKIKSDSIAYEAGMKPNQEIIQIDKEPVESWMGVLVNLLIRTGDRTSLTIGTRDVDTKREQLYTLNLQHWHLNQLKPDPLESLGITPYEPPIPPIVATVQPNSPAAGILQPGDKLLEVNDTAITDWMDLVENIEKNPNTLVTIKLERNEKIMNISLTTGTERHLFFKKTGYLGVAPKFELPTKFLRTHKYGPIEALVHAWRDTKVFVTMNMIIFGKLLTGKVSLASLGGPISIFQGAGTAINQGILPFLSFLAFISIAIGLINILPIPGLDGGHVLFQVIELITRKPVPLTVQILAYRLGLIFLLLLITQALVNDILRF